MGDGERDGAGGGDRVASTQLTQRLAPLPAAVAWLGVARSVALCPLLLILGRVHQPRREVGRRIRFADGGVGRVYRETRLDRVPASPCVLVVSFRLRWVRGRGHVLFRVESILNTPLFVGFPGLLSKLWLAADQRGLYRGLYEWDGANRAERYARSLWHVLALVSEPDSIDYQVLPGVRRAQVLPAEPDPAHDAADDHAWWRPVTSG